MTGTSTQQHDRRPAGPDGRSVTVTEVVYPWRDAFAAGYDPQVERDLVSDPNIGHRAAVELATKPGINTPVRWALTGEGLIIRWTFSHDPGRPLRKWAEVFDRPRTRTFTLGEGDNVRFSLVAVPQRREQQPDGRWERVPIDDEFDIEWWLTNTITNPTQPDGSRTTAFRQVKVVGLEKLPPVWSPTARIPWLAIETTVTGTIVDPDAAAKLMVGRSRAYGFGVPVFQPQRTVS